MKTKRIYNAILHRIFCLMLPLVTTACFYEHPELGEDGEQGIDPTEVIVNLNLALNLKMTEVTDTRAEESAPAYRHRIIVDAYLDSKLAFRQTLYKDITPGAEETSVYASLKMHARDYQLVVWADYVKAGSEEDLYYNTTTLVPAVSKNPYVGNAAYKDVLYGNQALQLSRYRNQWEAKVNVKMDLQRPIARYELVTNDVARFLKKIADKEVKGKKFTITVRYTDFFYTGFNALDEIVKNALKYISYSKTISVPEAGTEELSIAFDHVFVSGEGIPIAVEVTDESETLLARTYLMLRCKAGESHIIRSNFLTADPSGGGVDIETEYDDVISDNVEVE